jgi:hypothetical protein
MEVVGLQNPVQQAHRLRAPAVFLKVDLGHIAQVEAFVYGVVPGVGAHAVVGEVHEGPHLQQAELHAVPHGGAGALVFVGVYEVAEHPAVVLREVVAGQGALEAGEVVAGIKGGTVASTGHIGGEKVGPSLFQGDEGSFSGVGHPVPALHGHGIAGVVPTPETTRLPLGQPLLLMSMRSGAGEVPSDHTEGKCTCTGPNASRRKGTCASMWTVWRASAREAKWLAAKAWRFCEGRPSGVNSSVLSGAPSAPNTRGWSSPKRIV